MTLDQNQTVIHTERPLPIPWCQRDAVGARHEVPVDVLHGAGAATAGGPWRGRGAVRDLHDAADHCLPVRGQPADQRQDGLCRVERGRHQG